MKKCEEILLEFGVDYIEGKPIPEDIKIHFNNCQVCIREIKKQEKVSKILEEIHIKEEKVPELDLPPVLRKKDRFQFLILSIIFFLLFLFFHSILDFKFLEPYLLIFPNLKELSFVKLNSKGFVIIIALISLIVASLYQIKKILKKI